MQGWKVFKREGEVGSETLTYKLLFTDWVSLYVAVGGNICPCIPMSISNLSGNTHTKVGAGEDLTQHREARVFVVQSFFSAKALHLTFES